MAIVYKKSAMGDFLQELPTLILQYQKQQADRVYDTNMYLLKNEIDKNRELDREAREIRRKAINLGITEDLLGDVSGEDSTFNYKGIVDSSNTELVQLNKEIEVLNKETEDKIDRYEDFIGKFNIGKELALQANVDTEPGLSPTEQTEWNKLVANRYDEEAISDPILQAGASSYDPDFYTRLRGKELTKSPTQKVEEGLLPENKAYVERASSNNYPTIRDISKVTDDASLKSAYLERSNIVERFSNIDSQELENIAYDGAIQGGLGYRDILPGKFDISDIAALEEGLRFRAEEELEDKLGNKGYTDASIDAYVEAAMEGIKGGGYKLNTSGEPEFVKGNKVYSEFSSVQDVDIYKSAVSKAIYDDATVKQTLGQKEELANTLRLMVVDSKGALHPSKEWSEVKKKAKSKEIGFKNEEEYLETVNILANITDTNMLETMYLKSDKIRKLLKLSTDGAARDALVKLNKYEAAIENRLVKEEKVMPVDSKDDYLKSLGIE